MNKNRLSLIILLVLTAVAAFVLLNRSRSTLSRSESDFAIRDTSSVTRIFLADRSGNQIELSHKSGAWVVNGEIPAREGAVDQLLATMMRMSVKAPVARSAHDNVMKRLASTGVKVEIYQEVYRVDLPGNIRLLPHEKITRTLYVGDHTQDNLGTYMLLEGADRPYIVYLPGFRGFIATRFSPRLNDWRDHTIFKKRLNEIASASLSVSGAPERSYTVEVLDERHFQLLPEQGPQLPVVDTMKLVSYLASFDDIRFESLLSGDLPEEFIDSVRNSPVYQTITLTDHEGNTTKVVTHRRVFNSAQPDLEGNPTMFDRDRMYAFINDGKEMVLVQYFVFARITRPLSWFLPDEMRMELPEPQE